MSNEWITWNGEGEAPVTENSQVTVRFANGEEHTGYGWIWKWNGEPDDIVAWKLPEPVESNHPVYLGDAVYATYDGYHIQLRLNDHRTALLLMLETEVLQSLVDYARSRGLQIK